MSYAFIITLFAIFFADTPADTLIFIFFAFSFIFFRRRFDASSFFSFSPLLPLIDDASSLFHFFRHSDIY
jgi:hypothetical protein